MYRFYGPGMERDSKGLRLPLVIHRVFCCRKEVRLLMRVGVWGSVAV